MHAYTHVYILPYFERRYLYIIIYIYVYMMIFFIIYTPLSLYIISLTFGRQRGYHTNTGRLQIPTRAPRQYFGSRVFFSYGASLRFVLNE